MGFLIYLFTAVLVLDCLFLILLVLMQLPKKEAGAGLAFGGAATDALFGAGSGNFLTKATKYSAIVFFALAVVLSVMQNIYAHRAGSAFTKQMQQSQVLPATSPSPSSSSAPKPSAAPVANSNALMPVTVESTNSTPKTP